MYPLIRIDKLHPDGTRRASWHGYRIEDDGDVIRVWTPSRTTRTHVNAPHGGWTPESPIVTTWKPGDRFVASVWEETDAYEIYVDIVREVIVTPTCFSYVDLYVDVMHREGRTWSKDEELVARLDPAEARMVLAVRDDLLRAMRIGDAPFLFADPRWQVSAAVRALPPGGVVAL